MAKKKVAKKAAVKKKAPATKKAAKKLPRKSKKKTKKASKKPPRNAMAEAADEHVAKGSKKKQRSERSDEFDLRTMRGVGTFDTNEVVILVRGACGKVAEALKSHKQLQTWVKNAVGKSVTIGGASYLVYQLRTHPWVIIDNFCEGFPRPDDAKKLSTLLNTRAIFYGNSDTSCVTHYEVYDNGTHVELFETGDHGVNFRSQLRKVKAPKDGPDVYPFVESFIEEQDAF
jgi:hypothetical protein